MGAQSGTAATSVIMYVVIAALVLYRASRPQRISVTRMWVQAGLLIVLAGVAIASSERVVAVPAWQIAAAALAGLAIGIPVGILRGRHTQVSATDRHGVMRLGPSWATAGIYLGAFVVRFAIRSVFPLGSPLGGTIGDGLLVFAIAIVGATYYTVFQKYESLDHAAAS